MAPTFFKQGEKCCDWLKQCFCH